MAQGDPAANYPAKTVRVFLGFAAGGGTDFLARLYFDKVFPGAAGRFVVENRTGAGGNIAAEAASRATPDGYTLMVAPQALTAVNPVVYSKLPYDADLDFVPISMLATYPFILAVAANHPAKSVQDLVSWAKANPSKSNFAGSAATFRLVALMFQKQTGAPLEYISYRSSGDSVNALLAGEVSMTIVDTGPITGPLKGGQARALAVTSAKRVATLPDLPTMVEAGAPGMVVQSWAAIYAPAKTPPAIVQKIEAEIMRVARLPEIRQILAGRETEAVGSTAGELARAIVTDRARYATIAKEFNIKLDE